jgi:argininosuccinate lyase
VDIQAVVARRDTEGGTAPGRVAEQIRAVRAGLERDEAWFDERIGNR